MPVFITRDLVFTTELGRYLSNQTVYLAFKKVVRALGMETVRFHDLRHTFAVNSLKAGDDIKTVQENLGHHTAAFTLDVYAHVTSGMKQESNRSIRVFFHMIVLFLKIQTVPNKCFTFLKKEKQIYEYFQYDSCSGKIYIFSFYLTFL